MLVYLNPLGPGKRQRIELRPHTRLTFGIIISSSIYVRCKLSINFF